LSVDAFYLSTILSAHKQYAHQTKRDFLMQRTFDESAPKKATNLSLNSDLLNKARNLKINLSSTLEQALIVQVKNAQREAWISENREAINALNELSEQNGLFSDSFREF
jgi:antitoxin CcdA